VKALWKKLRYRLEWLALRLALQLAPLLSRNACYQLAGFAGKLAAVFDRRGRAVCLANLEAAFGDELSPARRAEIVRESYQHFARTMLDLFWSPRLTHDGFVDYIEFEGVDRTAVEIAPSNSCIVGTFHYGNFEWLGLATGWIGYPCAITTQEFKNPLLDELFTKLREQSGHKVVEREGAIIRLYKTLRRKGRVALLVDTTLPPHQPTVVIECFGLKTIVTVAHAWLQERTGVPVIPCIVSRFRPGGIAWSRTRKSSCRKGQHTRRSRRRAGMLLSRWCAGIPRRGFGCTSIGGTSRRERAAIRSTRRSRGPSIKSRRDRATQSSTEAFHQRSRRRRAAHDELQLEEGAPSRRVARDPRRGDCDPAPAATDQPLSG
jgi:lauroyl/myristoyl acyltransferase